MNKSVLAIAFSVGACSMNNSVPPITFAPAGDIAAQYLAITGTNVSPETFAVLYYDRNFRACTEYFDQLVNKQHAAGAAGMLGGAAGAIAGVAGGPQALLGGLAASTALASGLLTAQATAPLGGDLPVTIYTLWLRMNTAYIAAAPLPPDLPTAQFLGDVNAALCTPIGLQAAAMSAMTSAPVFVAPMLPTPVSSPPAPPPGPPKPVPPPPPPPPPGPAPSPHPPIVLPHPVTPQLRAMPPCVSVGEQRC